METSPSSQSADHSGRPDPPVDAPAAAPPAQFADPDVCVIAGLDLRPPPETQSVRYQPLINPVPTVDQLAAALCASLGRTADDRYLFFKTADTMAKICQGEPAQRLVDSHGSAVPVDYVLNLAKEALRYEAKVVRFSFNPDPAMVPCAADALPAPSSVTDKSQCALAGVPLYSTPSASVTAASPATSSTATSSSTTSSWADDRTLDTNSWPPLDSAARAALNAGAEPFNVVAKKKKPKARMSLGDFVAAEPPSAVPAHRDVRFVEFSHGATGGIFYTSDNRKAYHGNCAFEHSDFKRTVSWAGLPHKAPVLFAMAQCELHRAYQADILCAEVEVRPPGGQSASLISGFSHAVGKNWNIPMLLRLLSPGGKVVRKELERIIVRQSMDAHFYLNPDGFTYDVLIRSGNRWIPLASVLAHPSILEIQEHHYVVLHVKIIVQVSGWFRGIPSPADFRTKYKDLAVAHHLGPLLAGTPAFDRSEHSDKDAYCPAFTFGPHYAGVNLKELQRFFEQVHEKDAITQRPG